MIWAATPGIPTTAVRAQLSSGQKKRFCKLALKLWQEAILLTRLLGKARPPRALERLAQKAKFSQHTLTPEELETLKVYLTESQTQLQERAWYMQLIYRYVYVIY